MIKMKIDPNALGGLLDAAAYAKLLGQ